MIKEMDPDFTNPCFERFSPETKDLMTQML